jgi:2'-5' RNA ligase
MRAFVAVVPPEDAVAHLDDFLAVRRDAADFRWASAEQLHLTLAFSAAVPDRSFEEWVDRLERAARRRTPFTTAVAGGGAFPNVGRARVIWAGVELDEDGRVELDRLATGARAASVKSGLEVEGRRFRPHLTIARLGQPQEVSNWVRLLDSYRGPTWSVDRLTLIESHLGEGPRKRPRYDVLAEFPLGRTGQPATP